MSFAHESPLPVALFSAYGERVRVRGSNEPDASHLLRSTQAPDRICVTLLAQRKLLPLTLTLSPLRSATGRGDSAPPFPHGAHP
jgi:hypothetical protein